LLICQSYIHFVKSISMRGGSIDIDAVDIR